MLIHQVKTVVMAFTLKQQYPMKAAFLEAGKQSSKAIYFPIYILIPLKSDLFTTNCCITWNH